MASCCSSSQSPLDGLIRYRLVLTIVLVAAMVGLSYMLPFLAPFRHALTGYARIMALPLAIGLVIGGVIDHVIPASYIACVFAGDRKRNVILAVVWGFFMTMCSHGIMALSVQLYKKGASPASVIAFLTASPWANFPLTIMFIGFFGPLKAGYIILAAVLSALVIGFAYQWLEQKGAIEHNPNALDLAPGFSITADIARRWQERRAMPDQIKALAADIAGIVRGTKDLASMTLWWMLLGASLASAIGAYVPPQFFHRFMGNSAGGMLGTLVAATFMETCSTCTSPLAFEIYRQTGALGNALIFLLAGAATNYTAIGLLWGNAGRRTALWLPAIGVPLILLFGLLGNRLF